MKNKAEDLQNRLFATIEGLFDEDKPLDIGRAKAVAHAGSVITESAKVEMKALEIIGLPDGSGSTFLQISWEDSKRVLWNLRRRTPSEWSKGHSAA